MNRLLACALALSLAGNVWLTWRAASAGAHGDLPAGPAGRPTAPVTPGSNDAPTSVAEAPPAPDASMVATERMALEQRIEQRRRELAEVQQRLAAGADPTTRVLRASGSFGAKLRALAALPESDRDGPRIGLYMDLANGGTLKAQVLGLLQASSDPAELDMLVTILRMGSGAGLDAAEVASCVGWLQTGEPAEKRIAVAALLSGQSRREWSPAWAEAVAGAFRPDADPGVVKELAEGLVRVQHQDLPEAVWQALESTSERLPAGDVRAAVLRAYAVESVRRDRGDDMLRRWTFAGSAELREEIAAALAAGGREGKTHAREETRVTTDDPEPARKVSERRAHFLTVYSGTASRETRGRLLQGMARGFGLMQGDSQDSQMLQFLRDLRARETDSALQEDLRGAEESLKRAR